MVKEITKYSITLALNSYNMAPSYLLILSPDFYKSFRHQRMRKLEGPFANLISQLDPRIMDNPSEISTKILKKLKVLLYRGGLIDSKDQQLYLILNSIDNFLINFSKTHNRAHYRAYMVRDSRDIRYSLTVGYLSMELLQDTDSSVYFFRLGKYTTADLFKIMNDYY